MKSIEQSTSPVSGRWLARREVTLPTWRTCLVGIAIFSLCLVTGMRMLYPFLATDQQFEKSAAGSADLLCVEGWAHDGVLDAAVVAFENGVADRIAVTGGPVQSRERLLGFDSYAELGADRLEARGVPREAILVSVPGQATQRRTLHDIRELRRTLASLDFEPTRIQVISGDVHARRTGLLFSRVFGSGVEIRSCSVAPEGYDPARWWASSEGLKTVVMEAISWTYESLAPIDPLIGGS